MIKILFVCLGNICRSPMAEFIMKDIVNKQNLSNKFYIDSAATINEEIGNDTYPPAKQVLIKHNIPFTTHKARILTSEDYTKFDFIIGMEQSNIINIKRIVGSDNDKKIFKLMDFTNNPIDISDPYYHRDFEKTYTEIKFGCESFFKFLSKSY